MRRQSPTTRFGQMASASFPGLGSGTGVIYMLGLMLLAVLFFMTAYRGKVPHAIDKVFAAPPPTEQTLVARHEVVAGLLGGAWLDPVDGSPFAETEGYRRLLQKLIDHVRPGEFVAEPPLFDRSLAMTSPDLQRSETVRLRGIVANYDAEKLDTPVFQLGDVWRVWLTDRDKDNGVVVDLVEKPPRFATKEDIVEIDASFYRLVRYDTRDGNRREIPYLLGRNLRVLPNPNAGQDGLQGPMMLLLLVAIGGMLVWGLLRVFNSRPKAPVVRWRAPHIG